MALCQVDVVSLSMIEFRSTRPNLCMDLPNTASQTLNLQFMKCIKISIYDLCKLRFVMDQYG